jgi:hypothetical protein
VAPCSVREELEQKITRAQEEIGQSQYDSPKSSARAKAKLNRPIMQMHAHCGKHGCLRDSNSK